MLKKSPLDPLSDSGSPCNREIMRDIEENKDGTPRFPTGKEIQAAEKELLLTFFFSQNQIYDNEFYRRDLNFILSFAKLIDKPK